MVLISGIVGAIGVALLLLEQTSVAAIPTFQAAFMIVGLVLIFPGVVLMTGLVWIAETALLWMLMRIAGQTPSYMAILCSTGYANVPSVLLGSVVAAIAILAGHDISQGSISSLGGILPSLAGGDAVLTSILQRIDILTLWSLVLTVPALQAISVLTPGRARLVVATQAVITLVSVAGVTAIVEAIPHMLSSL